VNAVARDLVVHLVGSIPLADNEAVFRKLGQNLGLYLERMPDGETGIRQSWIRYLQDVLAQHPAIAVASDLPPFRFVQWDGRLVREIPRLRIVRADALDPTGFSTGYAQMATESWSVFERLQSEGAIPPDVKFQVSLPTPIAPVYNNMVPEHRSKLLPALIEHFRGEVAKIAAAVPNDRLAIQWDVCQEVLAWEGYYEPGPIAFRDETLDVLAQVGNAVPEPVELGFHLCYGSPLDAHIVQPADSGLMVDMLNSLGRCVDRSISYVHLPVPKDRTDIGFYAPLRRLDIDAATAVYFGLVHHRDATGNVMRLARAREHARVDGVATECGWGRGDPARIDELIAAHDELVQADSS
jgi:hypothetical protein